ncbi:histidine triad (HIT) family protein [Rhodoblastus acidophilus]|uniref:Histidine triad (HIT) family protein n=1 Tax=Rhodoblastus acidophilus TaxID=1074 RepID=A0A212QNX2_RHOAC|nr:HIT family protein [Rhodoblastus acidophilus]MCW2317897.1 histidine triad (HIT) family protein [Rhodoblastus acidophilus]PPQ38974.1 HIT family protein [Rhodoblastus acidophilus]RAI20090.1 HIT family protein [Rhodoblastus acidophilus]SNB61134.1 histidine triad (HIT) family protein [Rhodoblastus acidophilus]
MAVAYDPDNIFAKILRGDIPCVKVFEDEKALAFMDVMPRADGHVLVISKTPGRNIFDLPAEALSDLILRVQKAARAVVKGMGADGVTLHQFNEPAGGQSVFHMHFHVIPRWEGVALRPHGGAMAEPALLESHAAKIRAALD